ncbi:hypothetical protein [Cupriavidus necator]|uniref:hypothetical protein n=1 Tax=Cupriavidus necator TaxID=106590 RepID=UPI00339D4F40
MARIRMPARRQMQHHRIEGGGPELAELDFARTLAAVRAPASPGRWTLDLAPIKGEGKKRRAGKAESVDRPEPPPASTNRNPGS